MITSRETELFFPDEVTLETRDLLTRMLVQNPKLRITWPEIIAHPAMAYAYVVRREAERKSFRDSEITLISALENTFNEVEDPSILLGPYVRPTHQRVYEKTAFRDDYMPVQEVEDDYYNRRLIVVEEKREPIREVIQVYEEKRETRERTYLHRQAG